MVMTKSSSLTQVSRLIAAVNEEKPNTVRQRLKEWYQSGKAKKGEKRSTLGVSSCFAPLLIWVSSLLPINRPLHNIILRLKVFLVKKFAQIEMILIAPYFFSEIELATIDVHFSCRTI